MSRSAFTVVELLVVFAVIALLTSLVASALSAARQTARKIECSSNLRQIALAVEEYHSQFGVLPCSGLLGVRYITQFLEGRPGNWNVYGSPDPCMVGPCPEAGDFSRPRVLLCPSDPVVNKTRRSESYCFSSGSLIFGTNEAGVSDGIGFGDVDPARIISFRHVTDGVSSTALASEQLISLTSAATSQSEITSLMDQSFANANTLRYIWVSEGTYALPQDIPTIIAECDAGKFGAIPSYAGNPFNVRVPSFNHARTPNARSCNPAAMSIGAPMSPPSSLHFGGVNVAICDGSVRFISNSIDGTAWRALGTRAAGDTQSDF